MINKSFLYQPFFMFLQAMFSFSSICDICIYLYFCSCFVSAFYASRAFVCNLALLSVLFLPLGVGVSCGLWLWHTMACSLKCLVENILLLINNIFILNCIRNGNLKWNYETRSLHSLHRLINLSDRNCYFNKIKCYFKQSYFNLYSV